MSAIDHKYAARGGPNGFLGHPQDEGAGSGEMDTRNGRGRFRDFQGGSIYWSPNTGAFEVHTGTSRSSGCSLAGRRVFSGFR